MEDFYTKGKQLLNSTYGMMVTSILMPIHSYNEFGWQIEHKEAAAELKRYNKSKKRFLYYPWGIFCTAYARKNLWTGILAFGDDYIYSPNHIHTTLRWGRAPGKPSLAGACWAQTEDPSGCGAASPSQGRWDPDSLRHVFLEKGVTKSAKD